MTNPHEEGLAFPLPIHEAIFWRGVFIHRYSGVEHTVTELLLRLGGHDAYRALGTLPYPWPKKLRRLTAMLEAPGPLREYAARVRGTLTPLTSIERHRHLLVHGMMSCNVDGKNPRMLFLKSHDWIDGELGEVTMWITIEELIQMTQEMGPWAKSFIAVTGRIFRELKLLPISVAEPQRINPVSRAL